MSYVSRGWKPKVGGAVPEGGALAASSIVHRGVCKWLRIYVVCTR